MDQNRPEYVETGNSERLVAGDSEALRRRSRFAWDSRVVDGSRRLGMFYTSSFVIDRDDRNIFIESWEFERDPRRHPSLVLCWFRHVRLCRGLADKVLLNCLGLRLDPF